MHQLDKIKELITTDKILLLSYHFTNSIRNSNTFRPLKGHLQEVQFLYPSRVDQQTESHRCFLTQYATRFKLIKILQLN